MRVVRDIFYVTPVPLHIFWLQLMEAEALFGTQLQYFYKALVQLLSVLIQIRFWLVSRPWEWAFATELSLNSLGLSDCCFNFPFSIKESDICQDARLIN